MGHYRPVDEWTDILAYLRTVVVALVTALDLWSGGAVERWNVGELADILTYLKRVEKGCSGCGDCKPWRGGFC